MNKIGLNKLFLDYVVGPDYESENWGKKDKRSESTR